MQGRRSDPVTALPVIAQYRIPSCKCEPMPFAYSASQPDTQARPAAHPATPIIVAGFPFWDVRDDFLLRSTGWMPSPFRLSNYHCFSLSSALLAMTQMTSLDRSHVFRRLIRGIRVQMKVVFPTNRKTHRLRIHKALSSDVHWAGQQN